jgi:hypothetical protein
VVEVLKITGSAVDLCLARPSVSNDFLPRGSLRRLVSVHQRELTSGELMSPLTTKTAVETWAGPRWIEDS